MPQPFLVAWLCSFLTYEGRAPRAWLTTCKLMGAPPDGSTLPHTWPGPESIIHLLRKQILLQQQKLSLHHECSVVPTRSSRGQAREVPSPLSHVPKLYTPPGSFSALPLELVLPHPWKKLSKSMLAITNPMFLPRSLKSKGWPRILYLEIEI